MSVERRTVPREAVELYSQFIHGEISRRAFADGVKKFAVAGLTTGAIIDALMPDYALGQQISKTDERIKASYVTVPSPDGNGSIRGYFVRPASADTREATPAKLPGVLVIHENRGLNPHTEDVARRFALENFNAFAPDALTSLGGYPGDDYKGGQMFNKIDKAKLARDFVNAANWLRTRPDGTGKVMATGFCFGGGAANTLAAAMGPDIAAVAPFYGQPNPPADVPKIKAAVLVHCPDLDKRLSAAFPEQMAELKKNNVVNEGYIYQNALHGFFNDATPERYNRADAQVAWARTIEWFNKYGRATA